MKFTYLQHLPYRHLPEDFADRYPESVVTTPYFGVAVPKLVHADIRAGLDEAMHAVRAGFDAVALTEHGQSSYDMDPNPDLGAAALAYQIGAEDLNTGIYVVGRSLGKTREPLRVAEELAWLDNLSDGRLLAGFPVGLPYDANINAGIPLIETRARYDENLSFVLKAWTAGEPFAWNGKYSQYMSVNVWPRPFQQPHPPVSVTGTGNPNTTRFALQRDFGFNHIVLGGSSSSAGRLFDDMWCMADELGVDDNPFRANVGQYVLLADTDAEAERLYADHVAYSATRGIGHIPMHRFTLPGGISPPGLHALLGDGQAAGGHPNERPCFGELVEAGAIVAGSPSTVRERLADRARSYRVGNMLLLLRMGSMPTDLVKHNIDLFAGEVMPGLRGIWSEYEDQNRWWPARLGGRPVSSVQAQLAGVRLS
jgi:alkanesulfonate monooxygenase SsuD/methylene tetrahydromethanopterin reductase-like flavin-dependent oxidoreductase (luciferase family)